MVLLGAMPFASNGHSISNLDGIRQYGYCEYAATFTCHPCSRQGPSSSRYNSRVEWVFCKHLMWVQFLLPAPTISISETVSGYLQNGKNHREVLGSWFCKLHKTQIAFNLLRSLNKKVRSSQTAWLSHILTC